MWSYQTALKATKDSWGQLGVAPRGERKTYNLRSGGYDDKTNPEAMLQVISGLTAA